MLKLYNTIICPREKKKGVALQSKLILLETRYRFCKLLSCMLLLLFLFTISEPMLFLNGVRVPNNTIVDYTAIGEDGLALLCLTDLSDCCRRKDHINVTGPFGNWFYADGQDIPTFNDLMSGQGRGLFYDNRGMSAVRLNRLNQTNREQLQVPEGIFQCLIPDQQYEEQMFFVGMYSSSDGKASSCLNGYKIGKCIT